MASASSPVIILPTIFNAQPEADQHRRQDVLISLQSLMENLDERLATFTNWPYVGRLAPVHMAAAGFYSHASNSDAVSCFCCEVRLEGWNEQSDPITEHQRASPQCTWNNGTYMTTLEERLGSFHMWALDIKPLPINMAAAGFYHHNKASDGVTCFSCKVKLKDWKKSDDPIQLHLEHTLIHRPCSWILKVTNQPNQYVLPPPPMTPPAPETERIPRKCRACNKTFSSGNQFHKHRRQAHRLIPGRIGVPIKRPAVLKRSGVIQLGRYRVQKAPQSKRRFKRESRAELSGSEES